MGRATHSPASPTPDDLVTYPSRPIDDYGPARCFEPVSGTWVERVGTKRSSGQRIENNELEGTVGKPETRRSHVSGNNFNANAGRFVTARGSTQEIAAGIECLPITAVGLNLGRSWTGLNDGFGAASIDDRSGGSPD